MIRTACAAALLLATSPAFADDAGTALSVDDFAYTSAIATGGSESVHAIPIPHEVYETLTRADLGDLRVFNASGSEVPHAIRRLDHGQTVATPEHALTLYPLYQKTESDRDEGFNLVIERSAEGQVISIGGGKPGEAASADRILSGFVADASALKQGLTGLRFELGPTVESFAVPVRLEVSEDLGSWHNRGVVGHLVRMQVADEKIEQLDLSFSGTTASYLRLTWGNETLPAEVKSILAKQQGRHVAAERVEVDVLGVIDAEKLNLVHFDLASIAVPTDAVAVLLPEANSLVSASLSIGGGATGPGLPVHRSNFYNISQGDLTIQAPPLSVSHTRGHHRYWHLEVAEKGGGLGGTTPTLRLSYHPDEVLFLARGAGPFTLAYGSHKAEPAGFTSAELLSFLPGDGAGAQQPGAAQVGPQQLRGGETARIAPPPPEPSKLPNILLWALLLTGVGVLLLFVWRLATEQKEGE